MDPESEGATKNIASLAWGHQSLGAKQNQPQLVLRWETKKDWGFHVKKGNGKPPLLNSCLEQPQAGTTWNNLKLAAEAGKTWQWGGSEERGREAAAAQRPFPLGHALSPSLPSLV